MIYKWTKFCSKTSMITSSNGNIFRVTGPFVWGIHRSPVSSPLKGQWRRALMFSLICAWVNGWANNRKAGDLRRHHPHYDVIVMLTTTRHINMHTVGFHTALFWLYFVFDIEWIYKRHDFKIILIQHISPTKLFPSVKNYTFQSFDNQTI